MKNVGILQRVTLRHIWLDPESGHVANWLYEDVPLLAKVGRVKGNQSFNIMAPPPNETTCEVVLRYVGPVSAPEERETASGERVLMGGDIIGHGKRTLYVTKIVSLNEDAEETTVLCREIHA